jgi:protein tyrosine/serine phosphatase
VVVVVALIGVGVKYGRHHVFAKRFAEVEPGRVYRAGMAKPGPLERVVEKHKIRTILTFLKYEEDDPDQVAERALAEREGITLLRIPMPGNGCAEFDLLEQAAAVVADESHRPILVHCAAGVQRTGASLAVWRMKYDGWSLDRALDEMREHGYDDEDNPELREHLTQFSRERLATRPVKR